MSSPNPLQDPTRANHFLAIALNGRELHWYADVQDMRFGGVEHRIVPAAYVDRDRHRLSPGFDANWMIDAMLRTEEQIDEDHLLTRIVQIISHIRQRLEQRVSRTAGEIEGGHLAVAGSLAMLTQLQTDSYAQLYDRLSNPPFGHVRPGQPVFVDNAGAIRNCFIHGRCF